MSDAGDPGIIGYSLGQMAEPHPSDSSEISRAQGLTLVFRQLRWGSLLIPIALAVLLEATHWFGEPLLSPWSLRLLVVAVVVTITVVFYDQTFRRLHGIQKRLVRQNRELIALHEASLTVISELSLDTVLQRVVDEARDLVGTRYGALAVIDDHGRIRSFAASGIDENERAEIGAPPQGRGLLGVVLRQGQHLRLEDLQQDPRAVGFPEKHPQMSTLLAVPITCKGPFRGNLYLSEREDGAPFTHVDEETLVRFANQAAIAIDNAYLHHQVRDLAAARERMHIAHEIHDGVAQVLAFVNTQSQVVKEYLRQGKLEEAKRHLVQLSEAAREVYQDVRAQILDLRVTSPGEKGIIEALGEYIQKWRSNADVDVELELPTELSLKPEAELQILRIIQEALANVRKHSEASSVRVALRMEDSHLIAEVVDDGIGFDANLSVRSPNPRFGLSTMNERAQALGAHLAVESVPGVGTQVVLALPMTALSQEETTDAPADR